MYLTLAGVVLVLAGCVIGYRGDRVSYYEDDELLDAPAPDGRLHRPSPPLP